MKFKPEKILFQKALLQILFSVLFISGTATLSLIYFQYARLKRVNDNKYNIQAIMQSSREKEAFKTIFLAELLGLSVDRPTNLYRFNIKEAKQKLLASGLIRDVQIKKISPSTLYIDYAPRQPIAFLLDYTNTALDADGVPMPVKPYFTPKNLPEIYLGLHKEGHAKFRWGVSLKGRKKDLAFELLEFLSAHPAFGESRISRIDVSKAFASSYGQREIVIILEDFIESSFSVSTKILRLAPESYKDQLENYLNLREHLLAEKTQPSIIIDMRIPHLAFY